MTDAGRERFLSRHGGRTLLVSGFGHGGNRSASASAVATRRGQNIPRGKIRETTSPRDRLEEKGSRPHLSAICIQLVISIGISSKI
jgi:hypothetical protein